ncbi:MAG: hypothetical protein SGPRY_005453 [Prymnesium sp.]
MLKLRLELERETRLSETFSPEISAFSRQLWRRSHKEYNSKDVHERLYATACPGTEAKARARSERAKREAREAASRSKISKRSQRLATSRSLRELRGLFTEVGVSSEGANQKQLWTILVRLGLIATQPFKEEQGSPTYTSAMGESPGEEEGAASQECGVFTLDADSIFFTEVAVI